MPVTLPIKNRTDFYTINPQKIIALGLNYRAHIEEVDSIQVKSITQELPEEPSGPARPTQQRDRAGDP